MNKNLLNLLLLSTASLSSMNRNTCKRAMQINNDASTTEMPSGSMTTPNPSNSYDTSNSSDTPNNYGPPNSYDVSNNSNNSNPPTFSENETASDSSTSDTTIPTGPIFNAQTDALLPNSLEPRFVLPPLPYAYDALEPYIDAETLRVHHDRHHQTYVNNLNAAISRYPEVYAYNLGQMLTYADRLPSDIQSAVVNNGGGHFNHTFTWNLMSPEGGGTPTGKIGQEIDRQFGSFSNFRRAFTAAALSVFGSGYAWLVLTPNGRLEIITTRNQDTPLPMNVLPLLAIDVWEHAYYLKHQNQREAYVENFFNVINWPYVNSIYEAALQSAPSNTSNT